MAFYAIQTSFAAGELAPALFARVDLQKYHSGAALLRNWFVDYRGGASTRPGTQFITASKSSSPGQPRLIPFQYSTVETYILIFGDHYIWFISEGALLFDGPSIVEVATPYAWTDLPLLKYVQSADVLTLTHPDYPIYNLTRTGATSFSLDQEFIGPLIAPPDPVSVVPVNTDGTLPSLRFGYVVTSISANGEESLGSLASFCGNSTLNQNTGCANSLTWANVQAAARYRIYKIGAEPNTTPTSTIFGFIGDSIAASFVDNNIAPDYSQTPPQFQDPFSPGQIASITVADSSGSFPAQVLVAVTITGDGTDAEALGIVDPSNGNVVGVWLLKPGRGYTHATATDGGGATYTVTLGQQSGTYPFACGYFNQRRVFGGTDNFPESFVMSQPGQYSNFDTSPIQLDTDAITASIASRQVNAIKSFTAMPTGLIILTTGGGFLVTGGGSANAAVTPSNITAFPQASSGCNDLPPLVINYDVLYAQNRGAVIRDLAFNFYVQSYTGTDRSVLASHLFTGYSLQEWTYAEEPFRLVPIVRNDGTLLIFTYVPEQEIFAWTHWDTEGFFRSVASIPEGQENAIYVVVERHINDALVYYIERFSSRVWPTAQDCWCLDCALSLPPNYPNAFVALSPGPSPGTITIFCDSPIFSSGDVGKAFWAGGGWAQVVTYHDTQTLYATVLKPFPTFPAPNPEGLFVPYDPGQWQLLPNVATVSGLDHLNGQQVQAVIDGTPTGWLTVIAGSVTLPMKGSKVIVGLPFQCQLQTLKIDLGDSTVQGKRKQIPAITVRANDSIGLLTGPDFDHLYPMKELVSPYPSSFQSTDARSLIAAQWNKEGQIAIQQDAPLPATVLGIITEVLVGDTAR